MVPPVGAAESTEHKRLVKALMNDMNDLGFKTTCADYVGYNRCSEISKHIPDVEGQSTDGLIVIGEAKTSDDLDNDRTSARAHITRQNLSDLIGSPQRV